MDSQKIKELFSWPLIRVHLCTLAVSLNFNSTWRAPRDAFRYGGLTYGILFTAAMVIVGLPANLLQLSIGQLSQQDPVGVWKAAPFFRGAGYLRLLISLLGSLYSVIYLALTTTYLLYTMSHAIPFWECFEVVVTTDSVESSPFNASTCLIATFMVPVDQRPEYFVGLAMIILTLWLCFPFVLYSPLKFMKRIFYVLGPVIILLCIILLSNLGNTMDLTSFNKAHDWESYSQPDMWYAACIQALWSSQVAGGYSITSGDAIYCDNNVKWVSVVFIVVNILATWTGLIFWYSISGSGDKDKSTVAVLNQIYNMTVEKDVSSAWPMIAFLMLILAGVITMITCLYPLYDRFRRLGGLRWRLIAFSSTLVGAGVSISILFGGLPFIQLVEDVVTPFLIVIATVIEICAFVFIYGGKLLVEDIEFLTGGELGRYWTVGWRAAAGAVAACASWWTAAQAAGGAGWGEPPRPAAGLLAAAALAALVLTLCAGAAVLKQDQYDFLAKLKSSFLPSRHWGPRDPISHYYWLARRDEVAVGNLHATRLQRWQLGNLSDHSRIFNICDSLSDDKSMSDVVAIDKLRSNSDDWIYTVIRKQHLAEQYQDYLKGTGKFRSRSLDLTKTKSRLQSLPEGSMEGV